MPRDDRKAASEPTLNPKFLVVEGKYPMTKEWSISLPGKFNRRFEDKSLVIWRPGITAWIVIWNNDKKESAQERCKAIHKNIDSEAFALDERMDGAILRFAYRLTEKREAGVVHALYSFAFFPRPDMSKWLYTLTRSDLDTAKAMWQGLSE
jgi:hypothetical protein